jgi:hypothetical protein
MSTQKGNVSKSGPPKYQNQTGFRNNLHDSSKKTKLINQLSVHGVCSRCKAIIDWKIKYKKYKPLTQPKKCVKCGERTVTSAYYTICRSCSDRDEVCGKCGQKEELVEQPQCLAGSEDCHSCCSDD